MIYGRKALSIENHTCDSFYNLLNVEARKEALLWLLGCCLERSLHGVKVNGELQKLFLHTVRRRNTYKLYIYICIHTVEVPYSSLI